MYTTYFNINSKRWNVIRTVNGKARFVTGQYGCPKTEKAAQAIIKALGA